MDALTLHPSYRLRDYSCGWVKRSEPISTSDSKVTMTLKSQYTPLFHHIRQAKTAAPAAMCKYNHSLCMGWQPENTVKTNTARRYNNLLILCYTLWFIHDRHLLIRVFYVSTDF